MNIELSGDMVKVWIDPCFENGDKGEYFTEFTRSELMKMIAMLDGVTYEQNN